MFLLYEPLVSRYSFADWENGALTSAFKRDPPRKYWSFAVPQKCRNSTLLSVDTASLDRNVSIGVLAIDAIGTLQSKVNQQLSGICDAEFAKLENALVDRLSALFDSFVRELTLNLTSVLASNASLPFLKCPPNKK